MGTPAVHTYQAEPPPLGCLERWAFDYVMSTDLDHKLAPPAPPVRWETNPKPRDLTEPGRPHELRVTKRQAGKFSAESIRNPKTRSRLLHVFFHHELQAAELMCWAFLKFTGAERAFRRGLIGICQDEIRHMQMYRQRIEALGCKLGDFEVRDWFWQRVPTCPDKSSFAALMGLGLEAANLEHAERFAEWFRLAGDEESARVQARVGSEEVAHVAFARCWFESWHGQLDFKTWQSKLPSPLSPLLMKGRPLNLEARRRAGLSEGFLDALATWTPEECGPNP